jgi:two-component system NarL family response regulator
LPEITVSAQNPIRIMFVDDHPILREGLAAIIATQPDMQVVAEAGNGQQAVELFRRHQPDITLMDLRLPVMSGIEAMAAIRREFPDARFIVLTTYDGDEDVYRALQAGARAYLLKDLLRRELLDAIRAVHAGHRWMSPSVAMRLAERLPRSELTAREMDVLKLIVRGQSNKEIAATLGVAEGTIRIHVSNILSKLGVSDRTQAAVAALQRGLVHFE